MFQNDLKWSKMVQNASKYSKIIQNFPNQFKMIENVFQNGPNSSKYISQNDRSWCDSSWGNSR